MIELIVVILGVFFTAICFRQFSRWQNRKIISKTNKLQNHVLAKAGRLQILEKLTYNKLLFKACCESDAKQPKEKHDNE